MIRRFASALCCLLAAVVATAQVNTASPQTEQIENGFVPSRQPLDTTGHNGLNPGTPMLHYSIRLLPVSSFPQLPSAVVQQLSQMGCMIPQTYEAHGPENVVSGSFEKQGSSDWAVLCSVKGTTTLYVFFQSNLASPVALRHQLDGKWLGRDGAWSLDYGSAWGISAIPSRVMPRTEHIEHDGVQDSFVEQSSTIHYFDDERWTLLDNSQ